MAPRELRPIRVEGNVAFVPLTKGYEAIIDADDVHLVDQWNWYAHENMRADGTVRAVYAQRKVMALGRKQRVYMHRLLLGTTEGADTDHIDGDGLNNRRSNLRHATRTQNSFNRRLGTDNQSGFKGVSWEARRSMWRAYIVHEGKQRFLGYFPTKQSAAIAYAEASAQLGGMFARAS